MTHFITTARRLGWLCSLLLLACQRPPSLEDPPLEGEQLARNFWTLPVAAQAHKMPPDSKRAALSAERCGSCHPDQLAQWKTSLHAQAVSPGLQARTFHMKAVPRTACFLCHSPLEEQLPVREDRRVLPTAEPPEGLNHFQFKQTALRDGAVKLIHNDGFDPTLQAEGITCAGCHLRGGVTYTGSKAVGAPPRPDTEGFHRAGIVRTAFLSSAEFCRDCHQFFHAKPLKGKAIQNTYREWQASPAGKAGLPCQGCHMPAGQHLFRGIHDPQQVSGALERRLEIRPVRGVPGRFEGTFTVVSRGVGHLMPTYVTPRVVARVVLLDAAGKELPGTDRQWVVARVVDMKTLRREFYDTRLRPNEPLTLGYAVTVAPGLQPVMARAELRVDPDDDYRRKYEASLLEEGLEPALKGYLEQALAKARARAYVAFTLDQPLAKE